MKNFKQKIDLVFILDDAFYLISSEETDQKLAVVLPLECASGDEAELEKLAGVYVTKLVAYCVQKQIFQESFCAVQVGLPKYNYLQAITIV